MYVNAEIKGLSFVYFSRKTIKKNYIKVYNVAFINDKIFF